MASTAQASDGVPKVAVIGAGISGAACAHRLATAGRVAVTLFDMGSRPGGRASTRQDTKLGHSFDHGCQFIRASPAGAFAQGPLKEWLESGLVAPWKGNIGLYDVSAGRFTPREQLSEASVNAPGGGGFFDVLRPGPVYVAVPTMDALPAKLSACSSGGGGQLELRQGIRVQRAHRAEDGSWLLDGIEVRPAGGRGAASSTQPAGGRGTPGSTEPAPAAAGASAAAGALGRFDAVVLADSLAGRPGSVGQVAISGTEGDLPLMPRLAALQRVPLFALMVAFAADSARPLPFDAATLANSRGLHFISNNSSKPGRPASSSAVCWTAITTPEFAASLVGGALPAQDAAYLEDKAKVLFELLKAELQPLLGGRDLPPPLWLRAHRWGSAYVSNPLGQPCVSDRALKYAACGDFCMGAGVENAVLSGVAAAEDVERMLT